MVWYRFKAQPHWTRCRPMVFEISFIPMNHNVSTNGGWHRTQTQSAFHPFSTIQYFRLVDEIKNKSWVALVANQTGCGRNKYQTMNYDKINDLTQNPTETGCNFIHNLKTNERDWRIKGETFQFEDDWAGVKWHSFAGHKKLCIKW